MTADPHLKRMGRYEIQEEIGRGMMGIVYRALDPALGRMVALKTVQLAFAISAEDRQLFDQRFLAEARVAAGLSHPNLVVVHDLGHDPDTGLLFIAFEYLNGWTLSEITSGGAPMDPRKALYIVGRVAEALDYAHRLGVVHRDIKPANIMVLPSGEPKVMDFGVAKVPTSQLTAAGEFFGTPSYMSPEQASGGLVDGRSDLFSLGSVLYLLLTGRRAFEGPSVTAILTRIAGADPDAPSRIVPGLPTSLDAIVSRALAKDAAHRYPDGRAMAADLEDVRAGRPPRSSTMRGMFGSGVHEHADATIDMWPLGVATTLVPARRPRRREHVLLGLTMAGIVVSGLLAWRTWERAPAAAPASTAALAVPSTPAPTPEPSHSPASDAPRLVFRFEHPFRSCTLRLLVDGELRLEERLRGAPRRRLLLFRSHAGRESDVLELPPGEHVLRVEVTSDGFRASRQIRGTFQPGTARTLSGRIGGFMNRELTLAWGARK